jgi:hypothetical protein
MTKRPTTLALARISRKPWTVYEAKTAPISAEFLSKRTKLTKPNAPVPPGHLVFCIRSTLNCIGGKKVCICSNYNCIGDDYKCFGDFKFANAANTIANATNTIANATNTIANATKTIVKIEHRCIVNIFNDLTADQNICKCDDCKCFRHEYNCICDDYKCFGREYICFCHEYVCVRDEYIGFYDEHNCICNDCKCFGREYICICREYICICREYVCVRHEHNCFCRESNQVYPQPLRDRRDREEAAQIRSHAKFFLEVGDLNCANDSLDPNLRA